MMVLKRVFVRLVVRRDYRVTAAGAFVGAIALGLTAAQVAPVGALDVSAGLDVALGKALFERIWVPAPSSTLANDGLGPLFNARSCVQCHRIAGGGRIQTDANGRLQDRGAVVRLSGPIGQSDVTYGAQVQTRAIQQHRAEASVGLDWKLSEAVLDDGSRVELRKPMIKLGGWAYGALAPVVTPTLVLAPSLAVSAQIARVDVDALVAGHSPQDTETLGGRWSRDATGRVLVFGRKATEATIEASIAMAFSRDLGMSTLAHPQAAGDCSETQTACRSATHGAAPGDVEISPVIVAAVAAYLRNFQGSSVPIQNEVDGSRLFEAVGCVRCHQPEAPGRNGSAVRLYSDLRLHDMGEDLAGVTETTGQSATEWRAAPLIGAGGRLREGATLLHDGRARSVAEAILWHGGAADIARKNFKALSAADRSALERYVLTK